MGPAATASLKSGAFERWTISRPTFDGDSIPRHLRIHWKGDTLLGQVGPDAAVLVGMVRDSSVQLLWLDNSGFVYRLSGRVAAGSMRGPPPAGGPQRGTWKAERDPPPRAGKVLTYAPTERIRSFAAGNLPTLHVVSGDTVRVLGARIGAVPPVYVDGAYRGDVLAVRLLNLRLVPARAVMSARLDVNWIMPGLLRTMPDIPEPPVTWSLDSAGGVARLDQGMPRLGMLTIPLRPHVGMIGVAPEGNSVMSADEEGAHGGNLDYRALGIGATLYLPVSHAGALLSVGGDVHAAQGAGEMATTGLEANADIEFTVEVIEGRSLEWLRAEDATYLMAFGSSEDLNVALRMATTHLMEWLVADHGLDDREVAVLLGAALEIDVANVFGTQRTIVAKVPRALLPRPVR